MTGRHAARHKAPRSLRRSLGHLAADATGILPSGRVAGVAVAVGATGASLGLGLPSDDAAATRAGDGSSYRSTDVRPAGFDDGRHRVQGTDEDGQAPAAPTATVVVYDTSHASAGTVSRSAGLRPQLPGSQASRKVASLPVASVAGNVTGEVAPADPKDIAMSLMGQYGWDSGEFGCLDSLWTKESGWSVTADNPTSSAYGIPQSLPGEKMAMFGDDWETNPETQIKWGLYYIEGSYGSPCSAWAHSQANDWY